MSQDYYTMSSSELHRQEVIQLVLAKRLSVTKAADLLGLSRPHTSTLVNAYRRCGIEALISKKRARRPNNSYSDAFRDKVTGIVRDHYSDFGPTLAAEYLTERHGLTISHETLRKWMIASGLWTTRAARKKRPQQRRNRRECRGELVQLDGSHHDWFEGRGPKCCLLVYIDDATSELLHLEFVPSESTFALMTATRRYLSRHGRPLALYTDKAGVFRNGGRSRGKGVPVSKTDSEMGTQFTRALDELGIALICANSTQAKGRVERANSTLQDRLIKAMRLDGVSTMSAANAYAHAYIDAHNARFARVAANPKDLHRLVDDVNCLQSVFCVKETRKVTHSLDLRYDGNLVIIDQAIHDDGFDPYSLINVRVDILDHPNGQFEVHHQGRRLPHRIHTKSPRVQQSDIVSNKRLGATLAMIKAQQDAGNVKSYSQRRSRTAQPNGAIKSQPRTKSA